MTPDPGTPEPPDPDWAEDDSIPDSVQTAPVIPDDDWQEEDR